MRLLAFGSLLFALPALAKKPPLSVNAPETVHRYWVVHLKLERGALRFLRTVSRRSRAGKRILRMAGPFRLVLRGAAGEIDRYEFGFPLLGPGDYDRKLAVGLTADTEVLVPHRPGLRELVAEGPEGTKRAVRRIRRGRR